MPSSSRQPESRRRSRCRLRLKASSGDAGSVLVEAGSMEAETPCRLRADSREAVAGAVAFGFEAGSKEAFGRFPHLDDRA
ncbi:MAG: hypothetical protein K6E40_05785 [Desulfovibrio sp.]|nr:hypothetical protein [Desulfovibrio sp.]